MSNSPFKQLALSVLACAVCVLVVDVAPAEARNLSAERAKRVTERVAKRLCAESPDCVKYAARYCKPTNMENKRRCSAFTIHRRAGGERVQCRYRVIVRLTDAGQIKKRVGEPRCT